MKRYYSKKLKLARLHHAPMSEISKYTRICASISTRIDEISYMNFAITQRVMYKLSSAMGGEPSIFADAKTNEERGDIRRQIQIRSHMSAGAIGVKASEKPRAKNVYDSIMRGLEDALDHAKNKK